MLLIKATNEDPSPYRQHHTYPHTTWQDIRKRNRNTYIYIYSLTCCTTTTSMVVLVFAGVVQNNAGGVTATTGGPLMHGHHIDGGVRCCRCTISTWTVSKLHCGLCSQRGCERREVKLGKFEIMGKFHFFFLFLFCFFKKEVVPLEYMNVFFDVITYVIDEVDETSIHIFSIKNQRF